MKNTSISHLCNDNIRYASQTKYDSLPKLLTEAEFVTNENKVNCLHWEKEEKNGGLLSKSSSNKI